MSRSISLLAALATLLMLGACARPIGDLGRAEPNFVNDTAMPAIGTVRARANHEPVSDFNKTDEEVEMADRVWRFLNSGRTKDWFFDVAAELRRTRVAFGPGPAFTVDRYYNWLHATPYGSAEVRYATIGDDVDGDLATLPDTFAAICKVEEIDRQRAVAAGNMRSIGAASRADVAARRAENHDQIDWFVRALRYRYNSYDYALDHLLVETPHREARGVDLRLRDLQADVADAERGRFCGGAGGGHIGNPHPEAVIPSRFLHGNPPPADKVVKGS